MAERKSNFKLKEYSLVQNRAKTSFVSFELGLSFVTVSTADSGS